MRFISQTLRPLLLTFIIVTTLMPIGAMAGFEEGLEAHEKGDFATALKEWKPLAVQGHAEAQYNLGLMYANGQGVARNYSKAVRLYRLAAAQGDVDAQNNLGLMYYQGQGVVQDYEEAARLFGLAAAQGDVDAQYNHGVMYYHGQGVALDYMEAARLYGLAAAQGHARAQTNLGMMYANGQGVAQSNFVAYALYNLSATNDPSSSNIATKNRIKRAKEMSNAQIEAAQALTRELAKPGNFHKAIARQSSK